MFAASRPKDVRRYLMLMFCILIKKWQGHPKFKSGQNLINESYPKRIEDKGKEKGLGKGRGK